MTGILLLSRNEFYADLQGRVDWGPKSDKDWVAGFIADKTVFVGYKTWESIQQYSFLLSLPTKWVVGELTEPCDVHFGGPASFKLYPPDKLIIHRTRTYLTEGHKFKCTCRKKLISVSELADYAEIIYEIHK